MKISPILPKSSIKYHKNLNKINRYITKPDSFSISFKGDIQNKPVLNPSGLIPLMEENNIEEFTRRLDSGEYDLNTLVDEGYQERFIGKTLLGAAIGCRPDFADILLERSDIDYNLQDADGKTPLMYAIDSKENEIAKKLLKKDDININIEDKMNSNAISVAIEANNDEIFDILIQRPDLELSLRKYYITSAFHYARYCKRPDYALKLLKREDFIQKMDYYNPHDALIDAGENKWIELAREIIRREDYNPNELHQREWPFRIARTDLMIAIEENWSDEIIDELLNRSDIDVEIKNYRFETAAILANNLGKQDLAEKIEARKSKGITPYKRLPEEETRTPLNPSYLIPFLLGGDIKRFKRLLDSGQYDINARFGKSCYSEAFEGDTLLNTAISLDKPDFVDILLDRDDIDVNKQDKEGKTPLMTAIAHESRKKQGSEDSNKITKNY